MVAVSMAIEQSRLTRERRSDRIEHANVTPLRHVRHSHQGHHDIHGREDKAPSALDFRSPPE
jgi:hypothetical protein